MRWKNLNLVVLLFMMWLLIWTVAEVSLPKEWFFMRVTDSIREQGNLDGHSILLPVRLSSVRLSFTNRSNPLCKYI
jgi:hypothetical protein